MTTNLDTATTTPQTHHQECVVIYKCRLCHVFYESMHTNDMIEHACKYTSKPVVGMGDIVCFVTLDGTEEEVYRIGLASSQIYVTDRMTRRVFDFEHVDLLTKRKEQEK